MNKVIDKRCFGMVKSVVIHRPETYPQLIHNLESYPQVFHRLWISCGHPVDKNFTIKTQLEVKPNWSWNLIGGESELEIKFSLDKQKSIGVGFSTDHSKKLIGGKL